MASKKDKLSKKEREFAQEYAKTGNGVQSALKVYDTKSYKTASTIADANLAKPRIQEKILSIAEQIPDDLLVVKHLALLNKRDKRGIDTLAVKSGLEMAYKLKGSFAPEKVDFKGELKVEKLEEIQGATQTILKK